MSNVHLNALPRVLLLGDSIRLGYQPAAQSLLAGIAQVDGPPENGGDSRNLRQQVEAWVRAAAPDIVHLNAGLHDIRRARDTGDIAVAPAEYAANVAAILDTLRRLSVPRVLWATITPVDDVRHAARKPFDRREADVREYNAIAVRACGCAGVEVHDLHAVLAVQGGAMLWQDGIHLSDAGYRVAAEAVATRLKMHLSSII